MLYPEYCLLHGGGGHQRSQDADKMFLNHPSETRTKESNIYASVKVANLWTRNESKGSFGGLRMEPLSRCTFDRSGSL